MAEELGIPIEELTGSGPNGRILKRDVEEAARARGAEESPSPVEPTRPAQAANPAETAKGAVEVIEISRLQQTVARRMSQSKATSPHFYLTVEVEVTRTWVAREALKASAKDGEVVPSFNDLVVRAAAIALRDHPRVNGSYDDGRIQLHERVNVGIAVAGQDALLVPTIFDADKKGLRQIAEESATLAERVRTGQVTSPELAGATFTVSNLGMYGISEFGAIINSPQAAILAVGAIRGVPVVLDGRIVPGHTMKLTLSSDHRILYGSDSAVFLSRVGELLSEPLALAL